jgi:hypothetical protein
LAQVPCSSFSKKDKFSSKTLKFKKASLQIPKIRLWRTATFYLINTRKKLTTESTILVFSHLQPVSHENRSLFLELANQIPVRSNRALILTYKIWKKVPKQTKSKERNKFATNAKDFKLKSSKLGKLKATNLRNSSLTPTPVIISLK